MFNMVTGKKIALLGVAFKKDTGDVRETVTVFILWYLLMERADIHVCNLEVAREDMFKEMDYSCGINMTNTPHLEKSITKNTCPYAVEGIRMIHTH